MPDDGQSISDLRTSLENHIAVVEICRPPHNFFDLDLIRDMADCFEALDKDPDCRVILLASEGKSFCAGANLVGKGPVPATGNNKTEQLYAQALRLYRCKKPVVAAIQGAAVGGGLGVALLADFRITCPEGRFSANFTRLGFHPGFGLTVTLPRLIGKRLSSRMFLTGERIKGEEAVRIGLADELVAQQDLRNAALEFAGKIASAAPLAVVSTRATLRAGLAEEIEAAVKHELAEQIWLRQTDDFAEGVAASKERREPVFKGS